MSELCGNALAAGILFGSFIASVIWIIFMGFSFRKLDKEFSKERKKWNRVHVLNSQERKELDDAMENTITEHWE